MWDGEPLGEPRFLVSRSYPDKILRRPDLVRREEASVSSKTLGAETSRFGLIADKPERSAGAAPHRAWPLESHHGYQADIPNHYGTQGLIRPLISTSTARLAPFPRR